MENGEIKSRSPSSTETEDFLFPEAPGSLRSWASRAFWAEKKPLSFCTGTFTITQNVPYCLHYNVSYYKSCQDGQVKVGTQILHVECKKPP